MGQQYLKDTEYSEKMQFIKMDLFDYLASVPTGSFDVINCFGFLYHTTRQVDFFREIARIKPKHVIIDTNVGKNYFWFGQSGLSKQPCLLLVTEDPKETRNTIDQDGVAFWPTKSFLEKMFQLINYDHHQINYRNQEIKNWTAMRDYKKGYRISYLAHLNNRNVSS
ncbi:methyltransferase [Aphanothece sacrum FPU1]|uniref:Methyltransferase n=1 Tax=Aphanothece sacrum FPU1 TaxID=1920663 RepID=A0A401IGD0_APHSA|nr:methyltransferase [Aphanothece sacrum FPU1]GBF83750.1 methyltransferase [Aphanothece sacrum FPU3]